MVRDSSSGDPIVVDSLSDGNYFGEISLLRLDRGTNRYIGCCVLSADTITPS